MKRLMVALAIVSLFAVSAQAQSFINGIGLSVGYVDVENAESSSIGFGMFADVGMAGPQFSLQPYVDYWSNSENVEGGGEFKTRDIALGAKGLYNFQFASENVKPFLGAGLGVHFLKAESPAIDMGGGLNFPAFEASDTKLGVDLGGGIGFGAGPVELRGEGWYTFISDANTLGARASLIIPFGI
jgi:hypothetical protein